MNETTQNAIQFHSGYAPVNGFNMYYEIYGTGKPLVLIHGGGSTIQTSFGRIIPALSRRWQVIAMELQGHGRTADVNRPETFQQDADDVAALLRELQVKSAAFFGFSNGGTTTMQVALRHPQLVNSIILGSACYKREGLYPEFWESMGRATLSDMPQLYKDAYIAIAPNPENLLAMFEKDRNRMLKFVDMNPEDLRTIKVPALIISGDQDVVTPEHTVEMHRMIAGSRLAIFPGGHGKYIGELATLDAEGRYPDFIITLLEEFLNEPA